MRSQRGYARTVGFYGRYKGPSAELKFFDVNLSSKPGLNGSIFASSLNLIPQGTTESERIARKAVIKSIDIRYDLKKAEATGADLNNTTTLFRMIIYKDKQANGSAATVTDILEANLIHSHFNLANKGRFVILKDKTYELNAIAAASKTASTITYGTVSLYDRYKKSCSIPIEFDSTTGALTEIRSNNLGILVFVGNSLTGDTTLSIKCRLRYVG